MTILTKSCAIIYIKSKLRVASERLNMMRRYIHSPTITPSTSKIIPVKYIFSPIFIFGRIIGSYRILTEPLGIEIFPLVPIFLGVGSAGGSGGVESEGKNPK
jgi:hypothetical protein